MAIGTLGPITFNSSSDKVQTFEEYTHDKSARIATHENLQNKPIVEFIGPGLDKINLKLTWSIEGKINPTQEIGKLEDKLEKGEVVIFFLGGKPVGQGKYLIDSISKAQKRIDNKGNILSISFNVSLLEYPENARKETKLVSKAKVTTTTKKKSNKSKVKKKATTEKVATKSMYLKKNELPKPALGTSLWELLGNEKPKPKGGGGRGF